MRAYRIFGAILAFFILIPFIIVPAYIGITLSDGSIELTGYDSPDDPQELLTFHLLDVYYFIFIMVSIYPFLVLVIWSYLSGWPGRKDRSEKNGKEEKRRRVIGIDLFRDDKFPLVSVIIPCYNEDMYLGSAIKNAYDQNYPGKIEIMVIDDGSRDNTWSIGRIFTTKKGKRTINIFHKKNGGKSSALEYGISRSAGKILIMTDGDSEMDRDAVREIVETFRNEPDAGIVGGFVSIKNSSSGYLTRLQQMEYYITQHLIRLNQSEDGSVLIAPGPIFGMRNDLARMMPPLDRTVVEDCDLTMSVLPTGFTTRSTTGSVSYTNAPTTWADWFKQRRRWIYGQFQAWRENKWHLKKNPWGLYTYFTWVTTALSVAILLSGLAWSLILVLSGSDYYSIFEFISLRTLMITFLYMISRSIILLTYKETRKLILYIPVKVVYDMINGFLTGYLYFRYVFGIGVKMTWGNREEVVH